MLPQIHSRWAGRYVMVISAARRRMRETWDLLGAVNLPERVSTLVYLTDCS